MEFDFKKLHVEVTKVDDKLVEEIKVTIIEADSDEDDADKDE